MQITKDARVNALVERAKNIVMKPAQEWDKIADEPATIQGLYKNYALLLAAIPAVCGFAGSLLFAGATVGAVVLRPSAGALLGGAVTGYVLNLAGVAAIAFIVDFLAPKFSGQASQTGAFKLAVYSATPAWLAGAFLLLGPGPGGLLGLLGLYSFYLFYLGAQKLLKVPHENAAAFTIAAFVATAVVMLLAAAVLKVF